MAFDDGRVRKDGRFELGMSIEPYLNFHEALHFEAEGKGIDARGIAGDHAFLLESADTGPTGRFRESYRLAKFREGLTSISFQFCDNLPVELIHPFILFLRSEEHTSELQSLMRISYAVFCLKKKK